MARFSARARYVCLSISMQEPISRTRSTSSLVSRSISVCLLLCSTRLACFDIIFGRKFLKKPFADKLVNRLHEDEFFRRHRRPFHFRTNGAEITNVGQPFQVRHEIANKSLSEISEAFIQNS